MTLLSKLFSGFAFKSKNRRPYKVHIGECVAMCADILLLSNPVDSSVIRFVMHDVVWIDSLKDDREMTRFVPDRVMGACTFTHDGRRINLCLAFILSWTKNADGSFDFALAGTNLNLAVNNTLTSLDRTFGLNSKIVCRLGCYSFSIDAKRALTYQTANELPATPPQPNLLLDGIKGEDISNVKKILSVPNQCVLLIADEEYVEVWSNLRLIKTHLDSIGNIVAFILDATFVAVDKKIS